MRWKAQLEISCQPTSPVSESDFGIATEGIGCRPMREWNVRSSSTSAQLWSRYELYSSGSVISSSTLTVWHCHQGKTTDRSYTHAPCFLVEQFQLASENEWVYGCGVSGQDAAVAMNDLWCWKCPATTPATSRYRSALPLSFQKLS